MKPAQPVGVEPRVQTVEKQRDLHAAEARERFVGTAAGDQQVSEQLLGQPALVLGSSDAERMTRAWVPRATASPSELAASL